MFWLIFDGKNVRKSFDKSWATMMAIMPSSTFVNIIHCVSFLDKFTKDRSSLEAKKIQDFLKVSNNSGFENRESWRLQLPVNKKVQLLHPNLYKWSP